MVCYLQTRLDMLMHCLESPQPLQWYLPGHGVLSTNEIRHVDAWSVPSLYSDTSLDMVHYLQTRLDMLMHCLESPQPLQWYLPGHGVLSTNKIRHVDAWSVLSLYSGTSLDMVCYLQTRLDMLMPGVSPAFTVIPPWTWCIIYKQD